MYLCCYLTQMKDLLSINFQCHHSNSQIQVPKFKAVLYYTSCWDFVGIKIEIVGMDPNCFHPKPRPTTPHDFFDSALFLYQKET